MGTRQDGRIDPGQPLAKAISARAWNRAQDAADIVLGQAPGVTAGANRPYSPPYDYVYCRNTTDETVPRFGVMQIDDLEIVPGTSAESGTSQFVQMPVVTGVMPLGSPRWGIAIEPIAPNKIGRLAVAGVVQAKVNIASTTHQFVQSRPNDVTQLDSSTDGQGIILWAGEPAEGQWALIRFAGGSGGGLKRATFTGPWNKNTFREIAVDGLTGTVNVNNVFATIDAGCGEPRKAAIALIDGVWHLIAAECA